MKSLWKKWVGGTALASIAVAAILAGSLASAGSVLNSKHDLGTNSTSGGATFSGTDEVCVFCHTPHGADTASGVPLWNRINSTAAYTLYTSSTLKTAENLTNSPSLVCLSCHDGSIALNTMINAPGSGNYNKTTGFTLAGTWTAGTSGVNALTGKLATGAAFIGTDLSDDHPIAIPYAGGAIGALTAGADWTPSAANALNPEFNIAQGATIGSKNVWWVDVASPGVANTRDSTDVWLYTRGATGAEVPFVECASCHQPHDPQYGTFLRNNNARSKICLACHIK